MPLSYPALTINLWMKVFNVVVHELQAEKHCKKVCKVSFASAVTITGCVRNTWVSPLEHLVQPGMADQFQPACLSH